MRRWVHQELVEPDGIQRLGTSMSVVAEVSRTTIRASDLTNKRSMVEIARESLTLNVGAASN